MAQKDPEKITGKNWQTEVVDRSFKREGVRNEFYDKLARLKLHVETSPDAIIDDPAASGLKTFEELKNASEFSRVVNAKGKAYETGKGWTLIECLHSYFKNNVGITDAKLRSREVALALYYLTRQKDTSGRSINVDYLNAKWEVDIKGGQLFIYDNKEGIVVDGANLRKPGTAPAAPAAPALTPSALGTESEKFLARVRERSKNTEALDKKVGHVREALTVAKQKIDGMIDTAPAEEIAAVTNARTAWSKEGIFKEDMYADLRKTLQGYLGAGNREPRQLWRTEIVTYVSSKLAASSRADKSDVMERVMGAQIVTEFEDDPSEALKTSMYLDEKIKKLSVRKDIAQKMAKSGISGGLDSIATSFSGYIAKEVKIVVGGEFMALPIDQVEKFTFMRMVLDEKENRIYAQMQNGCRGNLVVIEVQPSGASAPPPAPGVGPGMTPVAPPPTPGVGPGRPAVAPPPAPPVAPLPGPVGPGRPKVAPPPGAVGPTKPAPAAPGAVPPPAPPASPSAAPLPVPGVGPGRPKAAPPVAPPVAPPAAPKPAPPAAPSIAPPPAPGAGPGRPPVAPAVAPPPGAVGPVKPRPTPAAPGAVPPPAPPASPSAAPLPVPGVGPGRPAVAPAPAPLPGPVGPGRPKVAPPVAQPPAPGVGPGKAPVEKPSEEVAQVIADIEYAQDEFPEIVSIQFAAQRAIDALKSRPQDAVFAKRIYGGFIHETDQILNDLGDPPSQNYQALLDAQRIWESSETAHLIEEASLSQENARQFFNDTAVLNTEDYYVKIIADRFLNKVEGKFLPNEIEPMIREFIFKIKSHGSKIPWDWEPKSPPAPKAAPPPKVAPPAAPRPAAGAGPGKPLAATPPAPPVAPSAAPLPVPGVGPGRPAVAPPPAPPAPPVAPLPGPVGPGKPKVAPPVAPPAAPKPVPPAAPRIAPPPAPGAGPGRPPVAPPVAPPPGAVGPGRPAATPPVAPAVAPPPGAVGPGRPTTAPLPAPGVGPVKPKAAPPGAVPPAPRAEPDEGAPARAPE